SPPPAAVGGDGSKHTRTYQACIPCRRRKVRCDMGPVDAPHEPPCLRCRRESKDCYFSSTRRKRKQADGSDEQEEEADVKYEENNRRKLARSEPRSEVTPTRHPQIQPNGYSAQENSGGHPPLTPNGSVGRFEPLRRPHTRVEPKVEEDEATVDQSISHLQKGEIFGGHDALNLLASAARSNGDMPLHRAGSSGSMARPGTAGHTPASFASFNSPQGFPPATRNVAEFHHGPHADPSTSATINGSAIEESGVEQAIQAWNAFKFVRSGWFTAQEGIAYIDYFYKYVAPLTPIVLPNFRDPASHDRLLSTEPVLALTILSISSRFMKLEGPGADSRPPKIHDEIWTYLKGMIHRIHWGQEKFGANFVGTGAQPLSDVNPLTRKGLRTLGTIEGLMLLTEWHPRDLHFPADADDNELMAPNGFLRQSSAPSLTTGGTLRIDNWLEPCWRSDRLCWMLLGDAMSLAMEIGVFDDTSQKMFQQENQQMDPKAVKDYYTRKGHLKDLLGIYITQTAGRLGLTSMLPHKYLEDCFEGTPEERLQARIRRQSFTTMVLHFWTDLASIMHDGNKRMFPNRIVTRELIRKGEYLKLIRDFQPQLAHWRREFDRCKIIPIHMQHIMNIEYEYARVYLNGLALQAVIERCIHNSPTRVHAQLGLPHAVDTSASAEKETIPASVLTKWIGNDRPYIAEIIDACRNVLRIVDKLYPEDYLKHVPVRTYFRIISIVMILLKTLAFGGLEDDIILSLSLLEKAVNCMRTSVVDDIHVIKSFCDLCDTLQKRTKAQLVRMHANGNGRSRGHSKSPSVPTTQATAAAGAPSSEWTTTNGTFPRQQNYYTAPSNGFSQAQYSNNISATSNRMVHDQRGANPALYGISTETYDPDTNNMTVMPPPTFGDGSTNYELANDGFGFDNDSNPYWLALPLDSLVEHRGTDVTQTTYGPDIGGVDLLDVLL
ncbi:hypothetical protein NA57DRAFT_27337, partial [Rhizodiscina lignyota]